MKAFWNEQLDLSHTLAAEGFNCIDEPWQALELLKDWILLLQKNLPESYKEILPQVYVHESCRIYEFVTIKGPVILGPGTEVRPGAFLRGNVLAGKNCVIGNSCELKNALLFDEVDVPHYNYVGDSILGYKSHMGAGAITSNFKSDGSSVVLHDLHIETGLRKMGAVLCDYVQVGCNAVLNPGTIVLKNSTIYPLCSVRGLVAQDSIYKKEDEIIKKNLDF